MTELHVVSKRKHVTRTKREKLAAVMAVEMTTLTETSKSTGIPKSTLHVWMNDPEFAQVRTRTREELADEVKIVAHLAWERIAKSMDTMEPRDAIFAAEKASTIMQLLTGQATTRTETRELTDGLDDHEKAALRAVLDEVLAATEPV